MNDTEKERTWFVRQEAKDEEAAALERLLAAWNRYHAAQRDYRDAVDWHKTAVDLNVKAYHNE